MQQLLVFAGEDYYPGGGATDFRGVAVDLVNVETILDSVNIHCEWAHAAELRDTGELVIVAGWSRPYGVTTWSRCDG